MIAIILAYVILICSVNTSVKLCADDLKIYGVLLLLLEHGTVCRRM